MMPLPPLAGRVEELDSVRAAWARTVAEPRRGPQVVLLTGDAGSGKSRLVAEALRQLSPAPSIVLAGAARAFDPAPYDWLASALSGQRYADLPIESDLLGWLAQRADPPTGRLSPGAVLRAAGEAVRALVDAGPGVLVVEDLHDLDPASLSLIADLGVADLHGGAPLPALLLVTSRAPHEGAFAPAAARTLRRLTGSPTLVRRHLAPLTCLETAELVESLLGVVPPPETVRALHARTDGNPYWITELVAAHRAAGVQALADAPLPAHIAALVVDRLAGEPAFVREVARAAALLGTVVHTEVLAAVRGDEVESALRRLVDIGMLVVEADGPLRFRYPLAAEALAAAALPAERSLIHKKAYAAALERADDDALARHAAVLGRAADAADAAVRAAPAHLAAGRVSQALELVHIGLSGVEAPASLLRTGAAAAIVAGRYPLAERYARRWIDAAPDDADAHRMRALVAAYHDGADGHLATAAEIDPGSPAQLAAEAEALLAAGRAAEAVVSAEAALRTGAGAVRASATVTLGAALVELGQASRGLAVLHSGRQLAEDGPHPIALGRALHQLVRLRPELVDDALSTVDRFGLEFRAGAVVEAGVEAALRDGDLARAEELVRSRLAVETDPVQRITFVATAGLLAVERGADDRADAMLARADAGSGARVGAAVGAEARVELLRVATSVRRGAAEAGQALRGYVRRLRDGAPSPIPVADAARWALRAGVAAPRVREMIAGHAPDGRAGAQLRCLLHAAEGADEAAVVEGLAGTDGPSGPAWQDAEVHGALARALLRLGRQVEAREHAEAACHLLRRWPGWRLSEAETLVETMRTGGDLTAREMQVLECLAAGMSNQQVARSLGISIRTVTVHVSNLLRKTGAASRTEAALWAVRHRLAQGGA